MSTFGLIVCNRSFFPDHVIASARQELIDNLTVWGHQSVVLSESDTKGGGVETIEDARACAKLFRENSEKIEGLIICMPNFGDELSVTEAVRQSKLTVPILVQACPDNLDKLDLANRRDAFCGKMSVCNNFRQCGIQYTLTSKHTCALSSEDFKQDVSRFAGICRVVSGLKNARIGAIGARPDAFHTVRYSEKLLQRAGIDVSVIDMSMILHHARNISDQKLIDTKIAKMKDYGHVNPEATAKQIDHQARLSIAIESFVEEEACTASAVQCWDAVQTDYGVATCLPMSMMGMKGKPSACEMDVMGAVSMLALYLASDVPPMLQDWNNNYGDDDNRCINVHCSNFPSCVFDQKPEIGYLDVLSTTLGVENCFGACKGRVKAGPMTFLRVSTDDTKGRIRCYVGEGYFTDDPLETFGGITVCHVNNMNGLFHYICEEGFEHHVALTQAVCADVLEEALAKYMGWSVYRHR